MNTIEDRLRDALRDEATTFTTSAHSEAMHRVRHRARRHHRRQATGGLVAAAVAVAATVFAVPAITGAGEAGRRDPGLTRPEPRTTMGRERSAEERRMLDEHPPEGTVAVLDPAPGGHGLRFTVWLSSERGKPVLCESVGSVRRGERGDGCEYGVLAALHNSSKSYVRHDTLRSSSAGDVFSGIALDRVRSVKVRLRDGRELPGALVGLSGIPVRFWQVGAPEMDSAKEIVFDDALLGELVVDVERKQAAGCGGSRRVAGSC